MPVPRSVTVLYGPLGVPEHLLVAHGRGLKVACDLEPPPFQRSRRGRTPVFRRGGIRLRLSCPECDSHLERIIIERAKENQAELFGGPE